MVQPRVNITEIDGALGVLPPSSGALYALVGVASAGPVDEPATFARVKDVIAAFGAGPLVEAAAHAIERYGRPVLLVRSGQSVAGAAGTVTQTGGGTSVATVASSPTPNDDYDALLEVVTGGTIGTAGIVVRWSLDGGETFSPLTALGTATSFTLPGAGGVTINFASGTLSAGAAVSFRTTAPLWNNTELGDALEALGASAALWEIVHVVGAVGASAFDVLELKIPGLAASGKYRAWIGNARVPDAGETEAAYLSSLSTAFAAKASGHGMLCAGACRLTSSVNGRKYRRPISFVVAAREAASSQEINSADVNLGTLPGVAIRDANGNPSEHDESVNPGLDDARFCTLRTWDGIQGVYVNRPRLFSADGSDFQILPHRRVMNLAAAVLRGYFLRRLNRPILVDRRTGFILESEAAELEAGANAALRDALLGRPKASDAYCVISRTENILSTKTLPGQARVVPLAYPETVELELGFSNPALQVQPV